MEIALKILLGLVTFICLGGGLNLLIKGAGSFLPEASRQEPVIDNLFRFLSGIYFGLGFLMAWVVLKMNIRSDLIYFVGLVVVFSGLGRLYSRMKLGSAGKYFDSMMLVEIILGLCIMVLEYLI